METNINDSGLNMEGYVGTLVATAHDIKQKFTPVVNMPCIKLCHVFQKKTCFMDY